MKSWSWLALNQSCNLLERSGPYGLESLLTRIITFEAMAATVCTAWSALVTFDFLQAAGLACLDQLSHYLPTRFRFSLTVAFFCAPSVMTGEATDVVVRGSSSTNSVDRKSGLLGRFRLSRFDDGIPSPFRIPLRFSSSSRLCGERGGSVDIFSAED